MKYINNTQIVKDSSELKAPYILVYNQVFVQNENKTCYTSRNISCLY